MRDIPFIRPSNERDWNILMFAALLGMLIVAYLTHDINFPWDLGTQTRALYVDEGFYSDAAQNWVKIGKWGMEHDSRHWPGSPLTAVFQSIAFTIFGASIEVARMLSAVMGAIGAWALYSTAKARFHPGVSVLLVVSSISTMTFFTIARSAFTDPLAMVMFLMAVWVFTRLDNRFLAIPLSLSLAFLAFFSKMYFIFSLATMITLWLGELLLLPLLFNREINRALFKNFILSLLAIALAYLSYRVYFNTEISNYLAINANKKPVLELDLILTSMKISFLLIPKHTQSIIFLYALTLGMAYTMLHFIVTRYIPIGGHSRSLLESLGRISRAEWAMGIFLVSGLLTVGSLKLLKTHYHFFTIIPIAYLTIAMVYHLFSKTLATGLSIVILFAHMNYQFPSYREWLSRPEPRLIDTVSRDIAAQIEAESPEGLIPVVGEFSSQLGLYSERIISIDAKWVPHEVLCERLHYWKPRYHVNVVWKKSFSRKMPQIMDDCPSVQVSKASVLYPSFSGKKDYIALTELSYEQEVTENKLVLPVPVLPLLR